MCSVSHVKHGENANLTPANAGPTHTITPTTMTDYEKLEYIHFAIQEAINLIGEAHPELNQAIEFVEDLREPYLNSK